MITHRISAILLVAAFVAACDDDTSNPNAVPSLVSARIDSVDVAARLVIHVAQDAKVRVTYSSQGADAPTLTLDRNLSATDTTIDLTRLLADRTYQYTAAVVSGSGSLGPTKTGSFHTPALPEDLAKITFTVTGIPSDSLWMMAPNGGNGFRGLVAVDYKGRVVWYHRVTTSANGSMSTQRTNGNWIVLDANASLTEVTPFGEIIHTLAYDEAGPAMHHDVVATAQNTLLFIAREFRMVGSERVAGESIWEWTPETGAAVKKWSAWDYYDYALDRGDRTTAGNWMQANGLAIGPHGNILISINFLHQIASIKPDWSGLEWRLGGRNSTFAIDSAWQFSGQHNVTEPTENHVLMLDNGRVRPDSSHHSRAVEFELNTTTNVATKVWAFEPNPAIYAPFIGSATRMTNGNTGVLFGTPAGQFLDHVASGPIIALEVTPQSQIKWQIIMAGDLQSVYRGAPIKSISGEHTGN